MSEAAAGNRWLARTVGMGGFVETKKRFATNMVCDESVWHLVGLDLDAQQVSRRDVGGDSDLVTFPDIPDRTCAEGRGRRRKRGVIWGLYWRG